MKDCLLLNLSYQPLRIIPWQKAIELWYLDKAHVIETYDDIIRSPSISIELPAVLRLNYYVNPNIKRSIIRLSRNNIYTRDNFTCMYCGKQPGIKRLTLDHVIPKSRGGDFSWGNIVTCCLDCNWVKANMTPEEARMPLLNVPKAPKVYARNSFTAGPNCPSQWRDYIGERWRQDEEQKTNLQSGA